MMARSYGQRAGCRPCRPGRSRSRPQSARSTPGLPGWAARDYAARPARPRYPTGTRAEPRRSGQRDPQARDNQTRNGRDGQPSRDQGSREANRDYDDDGGGRGRRRRSRDRQNRRGGRAGGGGLERFESDPVVSTMTCWSPRAASWTCCRQLRLCPHDGLSAGT